MEFSVRQSLAWMMLSQGGLFLLQFGGSVAMARLLTPYEMGIYAVASADRRHPWCHSRYRP